jgi:hypothetical protein
MSREITNKLLEMVDEGMLDARTLALACLKYMSEDEVKDMAHANEFLEEEEDEEDVEPDSEGYEWILNAGPSKDNLAPYCAFPTKEEAISSARNALNFWNFTEVVYMPEDDPDINDVVWRSWEVK